jgi:hypothetical protein
VLSEEAKRQMAELDARRTAHLRGEREWYQDPGRHGARSIGVVADIGPGYEVWTCEDGRRNYHEEPLGGIVLHVDAGAPATVDEWGELHEHPATFRVYDPFAPWPRAAFRRISEDEVNREAIALASQQSLVIAVRRFCREVATGKRTLSAFECGLVTDAARLVAVLMMGGQA